MRTLIDRPLEILNDPSEDQILRWIEYLESLNKNEDVYKEIDFAMDLLRTAQNK